MSQISIKSRAIKTIIPEAGDNVNPNGAGEITLTGVNDITITGNAATQTVDISLSGTTEHAVQVGDATGGIESLAVGTDGQVLIAASGGAPAFATLTSSGGTITFTPGANTLNLEAAVDTGAVDFVTDSGTATEVGHTINISGGTNINTAGAADEVTINLDSDLAGISSITTSNNGALRTGTTAADTTVLQAYDVDGTAYKTFATLTANNTPTMDLDTDVTIGTKYIYRADGTDVPVADGGTGASTLTDHGVLVGSGTSAVTPLAVGATGEGLMGATGADPAWTGSPSYSGTVTAGTGVTATAGNITATAGNIEIPATTATVGQITQAGTPILHSRGSTTRNIFVGNLAGNLSVTGVANVGVGPGALKDLTSGNSNTIVGELCAENLTTGQSNSILGEWAFRDTTSGSYNTGFGWQTGIQLVTGSYNLFLGTQAGYKYTSSESSNIQLATKTNGIGTAGESNTIRIGSMGSGVGEQNKTYIAGITGIAVGGASNVTLVDANGKLGTTAAGTVTLATGTNQLDVSADASATTVNIATGAAAKTVTIGSTNTTSKLDLKFGTADFSLASATGNVIVAQDTGEVTMPLQPAFLSFVNAGVANVTGNNTKVTVQYNTEVFDQNADYNNGTYTFTAPCTGKFFFEGQVNLTGVTTATSMILYLTTSNRSYRFAHSSPTAMKDNVGRFQYSFTKLADMDAGDTAIVEIQANGQGTDTIGYDGNGSIHVTSFSGHLVC